MENVSKVEKAPITKEKNISDYMEMPEICNEFFINITAKLKFSPK